MTGDLTPRLCRCEHSRNAADHRAAGDEPSCIGTLIITVSLIVMSHVFATYPLPPRHAGHVYHEASLHLFIFDPFPRDLVHLSLILYL